MLRKLVTATLLVATWSATSWATGVLIPKDKHLPPLAIKHQRVSIEITDQVAKTHVEQVFQNHVNRDLEATYIFPLPKGAAVTEFAMYINGKRASGELLEKDKARKIYEDIVRRMKDPGLLEYLDNHLFRVRVYPVPRKGRQRIEITYSEVLKLDTGVCRYVYPLRTGEKASRTLDDFTVSAKLSSKMAIKSVYSPSHKVGVTRKDDHHATVGFEEQRGLLDRDFVLYYTVSEKDVAISLLTHRVKGDSGYFMLMISPKVEVAPGQVLAKDICFVIDTSGSMSGRKITQAKAALKYCLENLNKGDRFQVIRFSTTAEAFAEGLVEATPERIKKALAFTAELRAAGGTAIDEALKEALKRKPDAKRPYIIAFLTDGLPTIGETNPERIVQNARDRLKANARIFCFGVGHDLDTHLLDKITETARGYSEYVRPKEDIELKVSRFYDKVSSPVLADLKLDLPKVRGGDIYPRRLPDLFKGTQLVVFGRYRDAAHVAVTLTGQMAGKAKTFAYDADFPEAKPENDFIKRLWATRKVGYLLDEIRLHGEKKELRDEVVRLSKAFNIITPYTSYLVVEDEKPRPRPVATTPVRRNVFAMTRLSQPGSAGPAVAAEREARLMAKGRVGEALRARSEVSRLADRDAAGYGGRALQDMRVGKQAVDMAQVLKEMKREQTAPGAPHVLRTREIAGKTFHKMADTWVDAARRTDRGKPACQPLGDSGFADHHDDCGVAQRHWHHAQTEDQPARRCAQCIVTVQKK